MVPIIIPDFLMFVLYPLFFDAKAKQTAKIDKVEKISMAITVETTIKSLKRINSLTEAALLKQETE